MEFNGDLVIKILCCLVAYKIVMRRLVTCHYLSIKQLSTGMPTIVMFRDEQVKWSKLNMSDRLTTYKFLMFPDARFVSDMKYEPAPYGLWDGMKVRRYVLLSFVSTAISLGFCYLVFVDWHRIQLIQGWTIVGVICCLIFAASKLSKGLSYKLKKKWPVLNLRTWEIIRGLTFGYLDLYNDQRESKHGFLFAGLFGIILFLTLT